MLFAKTFAAFATTAVSLFGDGGSAGIVGIGMVRASLMTAEDLGEDCDETTPVFEVRLKVFQLT